MVAARRSGTHEIQVVMVTTHCNYGNNNMSHGNTYTSLQGNDWKKADVPVFGHGYRRYYIKGVAGASYAGDIAIDDISFRRCELNKLCSDDQFTCDVAQCIDAEKVG